MILLQCKESRQIHHSVHIYVHFASEKQNEREGEGEREKYAGEHGLKLKIILGTTPINKGIKY